MKKLILFGTLGCHLCEEANQLISACDLNNIEIEHVDIAEHEQWQEKYAIRIPVLYHSSSKKELNWPFTELDVQRLIDKLSND
jgi:hypothetical protein